MITIVYLLLLSIKIKINCRFVQKGYSLSKNKEDHSDYLSKAEDYTSEHGFVDTLSSEHTRSQISMTDTLRVFAVFPKN